MTTLARGGISAVKKSASSNSEAPVWKSYLAIRLSRSNASNTADLLKKRCENGNLRGRKRAKPSAGQGRQQGASTWMTLATTRQSSRDGGAVVLKNIRHYWEQLCVHERQQILFLDEPEPVKQLYKLNLSLLCVGLMQRHLKTSNRKSVASADKKLVAASVTFETKKSTSINAPVVQERAATLPSAREVSDASSEKTYELLEAMEFMDISTGILTVKTELAEDTDRLFTLVGDVLEGFLTSIHVLTESSFNKLFVMESETINTWANYQRLIAMLVEQLILRSYVSHLEREAAQQMEQLLLEVSLEDESLSTRNSASYGKKKAKKRKSTRRGVPIIKQTSKLDTAKSQSKNENPRRIQTEDNSSTGPSSKDEVLAVDLLNEQMSAALSISADSECGSIVPTEFIDEVPLDVKEAVPEAGMSTGKLSSLNPNALEFQPQQIVPTTEIYDARAPSAGKRKLDEYIVNVPWEDVDSAFDSQSIGKNLSGGEDEFDDSSARQQWRRKQRRREEDASLEWQLQQVYASTSSFFGWDFLRQCQLPDAGANIPWSDSTLWRTAPKEVVRYFSPGAGYEYSHFLPRAPSKYYFNPKPLMSFGSPLLHNPILEPSLDGSFVFPPSTVVVSSPDFFNGRTGRRQKLCRDCDNYCMSRPI